MRRTAGETPSLPEAPRPASLSFSAIEAGGQWRSCRKVPAPSSHSRRCWDGHSDVHGNHTKLCAQSDLPVAGLLKDLKSRGLLDSTVIVWAGEFGRIPMSEGGNGRDHNPHGFSMRFAGGGVKGGQVIGATDAVGLRAVEERTHAHDIPATILHLLGLDHTRLTYRHDGQAGTGKSRLPASRASLRNF